MVYGLRIKDANGATILTFTNKITRLMWKSSHTSSAGNSGALSNLDGILTGDFAVPVNADLTKTALIVSRNGNTISWTPYIFNVYLTTGTCVVFSFAYT